MKNIKFEKNGKIFNLKAIVCENKDLIKYIFDFVTLSQHAINNIYLYFNNFF